MDPISSTGFATGGQSIFSSQGGTFGDNPFLQILVTQMRSQTPLDPVSDGDFMQQMASFNTMEEQRQLNDNLLKLLSVQGAIAKLQGLSEGSTLLGKEVTYDPGDGTEKKGIVQSVFVNKDGEVRIVTDEDEVGFEQILGVADPKNPLPI